MATVDDGNACVPGVQLSFQLTLDAAVYPAAANPSQPAQMSAVLTFISTSTPPLVLEWFSGQRYDVVITNGSGVAVYHWSHGRIFPMLATLEPVSGTLQWVVEIPLADDEGVALPAGPYLIRAYLTTSTSVPGVSDGTAFAGMYSASLLFRVGT